MMNRIKTLQELNLLDRFLFSEVMADNEILEDVLEIILGHPVPLKDKAQAENELRRSPQIKSVYFDVYGEDYSQLKDAYVIMIMSEPVVIPSAGSLPEATSILAPNHEISSIHAYIQNCISGIFHAMRFSALVKSVYMSSEIFLNFSVS